MLEQGQIAIQLFTAKFARHDGVNVSQVLNLGLLGVEPPQALVAFVNQCRDSLLWFLDMDCLNVLVKELLGSEFGLAVRTGDNGLEYPVQLGLYFAVVCFFSLDKK